jgi:enoyl-[acyl-carrier protein] reductase/trans-2-enoyl-CoA reductase (NAD+)
MKQDGSHEGSIEQIYRLFTECLYSANPRRDDAGRNRVDDREMRREVQGAVEKLWPQVTTENLNSISDFRGYRAEFLNLFGFGVPGIDYDADINPEAAMNHLVDLTPQVV